MSPQAFFDLAAWLLTAETSAASFRSVNSRAYYGALHRAGAFLAAMEVLLPRDANRHARVPELLRHANIQEITEVAAMLTALRSQRNEADYDLDKTHVETAGFAASRLNDAGTIIGRLNTLQLGKGKSGSKFETARASIKPFAEFLFRGPQTAS